MVEFSSPPRTAHGAEDSAGSRRTGLRSGSAALGQAIRAEVALGLARKATAYKFSNVGAPLTHNQPAPIATFAERPGDRRPPAPGRDPCARSGTAR